MATWLALFRGINVGGNNILRMKELVSLFEGLGFEDVRTYIQSGNVIFRARDSSTRKIALRVEDAVAAAHGFRPQIIILPAKEIRRVMAANPFPAAMDAPKSLHCFFLAELPDTPDLEALGDLKSSGEEFVLADSVFYLHAPQGVGRSRLAARVEKLLGVPTTARNWRTVTKIDEIARQIDR
jgi:uncharacterized protein (DUF1697 family)